MSTYVLAREDYMVFGDDVTNRTLMIFAWSRGIPITRLATLLGRSRYGLMRTVDMWIRYGILADRWRKGRKGAQRIISLNRNFCAYWSMLEIMRAIDRGTGLEYKGLARSYRAQFQGARLAPYNAKKRREKQIRKAQRSKRRPASIRAKPSGRRESSGQQPIE